MAAKICNCWTLHRLLTFFFIGLFSWFSSNVLETLTWFGGFEPGMCGNSVVWRGDQG